MRVRDLTKSALFAALLCVISPISIPLGAVPVSFATLGVYFAAIMLRPLYAVLSVLVYVLIGMLGLPVFSGFSGGVGVIAGPTGGYIIGYILCVWIAAMLKDRVNIPLSLTLGTLAVYIFGTVWFVFVTGSSGLAAVLTCVMPFVLGDTVKIIIATVLGKKIKKRAGQ